MRVARRDLPVEGRARRPCLRLCGSASPHRGGLFVDARRVEGAVIGTKRQGGGPCSEIYSVSAFSLVHCPANTAITAAAVKVFPAMRNVLLVVRHCRESQGMTYGGKRSISPAAHPQPDNRTYFPVWSSGRLTGQSTPDFKFTACPLLVDARTLRHLHKQFWNFTVREGSGLWTSAVVTDSKTPERRIKSRAATG